MSDSSFDFSFDYKPFCEQIARDAGKLFLKYYKADMGAKLKPDKSVVTKADLEINSLIIERVAKHFPTHRVLGEEESSDELNSDYIWVTDPVDGTFPFSIHIAVSVISLALTYKGEPIVGMIYDPHGDMLYFAQKGKGATVNGQKISVSQKNFGESAKIFLDDSSTKSNRTNALRAYLSETKSWDINIGSITHGGALVARAAMDGLVFIYNKPWDSAAYAVIITEAGGKVTDIAGKSQRYDREINGCIASNGIIHDKLVELVQKDIKHV